MNRKLKISTIVAVVATLGLSSQAWGACNLDGSVTGASSVYDMSGQGNFTCADLNFQYDLTSVATITYSTDGDVVESVSVDDTGSGDPLIDKEIRAVVVKPSNGDRCVYNYPTVTFQAFDLTPDSDKPVSEVVVCSDGKSGIVEAVPEPEPTLPVTTAGLACTGDIKIGTDSIFSDTTAEVAIIAESLDGQTVASCSLTNTGQEFCDDRCVNFEDRGESSACVTSVVQTTGEFNLLACQPCDTALQVIADNKLETDPTKRIPEPVNPATGNPMEFCWEKVNSVYETGDLAGMPPDVNGIERSTGTMFRHTAVRQSDTSITWYNKCRKSTITLNGIDYTTTTCK